MERFYAGIGSRQTPIPVRLLMLRLGIRLAELGFTLRSGAAPGADVSFEAGCDLLLHGIKEIYIPWNGFEGRRNAEPGVHSGVSQAALDLAAQFHPAWSRCRPGARSLHARNGYQILGLDLATPVDFVVCWTPQGTGSGGTGQALRLARAHQIPIFDLGLGRSAWDALKTHMHAYREEA